MNFYPNYYPSAYQQNYGANPYMMQGQQQQQMPIQQQPTPQPQMPFLNGKIVDSADVVRATEVPIGGYGVFPKADLSEVYIKSWNNNGTTSVITFKPVIPTESSVETPSIDTTMNQVLEKLNQLETKLNEIVYTNIPNQVQQQPQVVQEQAPQNIQRKEVNLNAY